jgi:hypothetical protein
LQILNSNAHFLGHVSLMFDTFTCSSVRTLHSFPFRYS